jgi:hypothetical protein
MNPEEIRKKLKQSAEKLQKENDIKSAIFIIEKCLLGGWGMTGYRINPARLALKVLLEDRERLEEENLHWKGQYHLLSRKILPDYISKDKIITKIKELEEEIKKDKIEYDKEKNELFKLAIQRNMIEKIKIKKVLEELLEGE